VEPTAKELVQIVMNHHPMGFILIPDWAYMILNMIQVQWAIAVPTMQMALRRCRLLRGMTITVEIG